MENLVHYAQLDTISEDLKILVISTNEELKNSLHYFFDKLDCEIHYLFDKKDILNFYEKTKVNIIFIDLNIKQTNPFNIIQAIKYKHPLQYIIGVSSKDSKELLYKCIKHDLNDFLLTPLTKIQVKDSVIEYLKKIDYINKITNLTEETNKNKTPCEAVNTLIKRNRLEIELIGQYKGIPIIKKATFLNTDNDYVKVKIENIHKHLLKYSKKIVLSSLHLSHDIYAKLSTLDEDNNIAIFHQLSFIDSYIHHRKHIRITPDNNFILNIEFNKINYTCNILNISENYALLKIVNLPKELKINTNFNMDLSFKSIDKNRFNRIKTTCNIYDIFEVEGFYKVLIYFDLKSKDKELLQNYIHQWALFLVKEFKKIASLPI